MATKTIHIGMATDSVIMKFNSMIEESGSLVETLCDLLLRQQYRTKKYDFEPRGGDAREWEIEVELNENVKPLEDALQELDAYSLKNRFLDRSSALEDLLFGDLDDSYHTDTENIEIKIETDEVEDMESTIEQSSPRKSIVFVVGDGHELPESNECYKENDTLACILCKKEYVDQDDLMLHYENKHTRDVILCPICNETFNNRFSILTHCRQKHLKHVNFLDDGSMKISERSLVKCPKCEYVALKKGRMSNHLKKVHGIIEEIFCEYCGKEFKEHRAKQHHVSQFHTMHNIACELCGKICKNRSSFQRHHLMHTRSFECETCGKVFADRRCHAQHLKLHKIEGQFACTQCDRTFHQKNNLEMHMNIKHLKAGKLLCEECPFSTYYKTSLEKHFQSFHVKDREYRFTCPHCMKGFTRRTIFEEHLDVHEGRYRYSCSMCGRNFRNRSRCKQHETKCTGDISKVGKYQRGLHNSNEEVEDFSQAKIENIDGCLTMEVVEIPHDA